MTTPNATKTTKLTPHELKMWREDTGGWARNQFTSQATERARMCSYNYASIVGPGGEVLLPPFAVVAPGEWFSGVQSY